MAVIVLIVASPVLVPIVSIILLASSPWLVAKAIDRVFGTNLYFEPNGNGVD